MSPRRIEPGLRFAPRGVGIDGLDPVPDEVTVADCRLGRHPDKAELLDALAASLPLPAWFGRNWDALADVMGDLRGPHLLVIDGLERLDEATRSTAIEILARAVLDAARGPSPLAVVVTDAGYGTVMEGSEGAEDSRFWLEG